MQPPNPQLELTGYANWQSGEVEILVVVDSTPTLVTTIPWPGGKDAWMTTRKAMVRLRAPIGMDAGLVVRLFVSEVLKALGQRRTASHVTGWCGVFREWIVTKARETATRLAQLAEHQIWDLGVAGSIPVPHRRLLTCSPTKGTGARASP